MNAALKIDFVDAADYLEGEERSEIKHEFVRGVVYGMAGASREHNRIAGNFFAALHNHIGGGNCQVSMSDLKLQVGQADAFYYPDVMVTCDPRDKSSLFNQYPKVIIEVLSEGTERIDRIEKFSAYTQIETLEEYVLIAQSKAEAIVFRRANGWAPEIVAGLDSELRLRSLNFAADLGRIYAGVTV